MSIRSAVLYTALALGAIGAPAGADPAAFEALRTGDMKKLIFAAEPAPVSDAAFALPDGTERRLSDWQGRHVLLNFWATWCAPCRKEMPALDALEAEFGGADFAVLTLATGRNPMPAIERFYAEAGIVRLPVLLDPDQAVAREMAVFGLPVTVLIDPEGREIARLRGDADWHSDAARALIAAVLDGG